MCTPPTSTALPSPRRCRRRGDRLKFRFDRGLVFERDAAEVGALPVSELVEHRSRERLVDTGQGVDAGVVAPQSVDTGNAAGEAGCVDSVESERVDPDPRLVAETVSHRGGGSGE
jgi:hypothetical protein